MIAQSVAGMLVRDLQTVRREIEAYADDDQPWQLVPGLANSGGTLVLHLAGNLQHYIGAMLGGSGYVRDRPAEFSRRNVTGNHAGVGAMRPAELPSARPV